MLRQALLLLHLLAAMAWMGGMFFAYFCLRPGGRSPRAAQAPAAVARHAGALPALHEHRSPADPGERARHAAAGGFPGGAGRLAPDVHLGWSWPACMPHPPGAAAQAACPLRRIGPAGSRPGAERHPQAGGAEPRPRCDRRSCGGVARTGAAAECRSTAAERNPRMLYASFARVRPTRSTSCKPGSPN